MQILRLIFKKQLYHYLFLAILLVISILAASLTGAYEGYLWNHSTRFWLWLSIGIVIAHQFYVWLVWRLELHLKFFTRKLGKAAFPLWSIFFMIFLACRFLFVFFVGYSNRGTLNIFPFIGWIISAAILILAAYTGYSILRYFSIRRALGIDHFDPTYRSMDMVRKGIYKYVPNAMYVFALALVWVPALIFYSKAALISAFFNHAYIWVHYYTVELPDMRIIYGNR